MPGPPHNTVARTALVGGLGLSTPYANAVMGMHRRLPPPQPPVTSTRWVTLENYRTLIYNGESEGDANPGTVRGRAQALWSFLEKSRLAAGQDKRTPVQEAITVIQRASKAEEAARYAATPKRIDFTYEDIEKAMKSMFDVIDAEAGKSSRLLRRTLNHLAVLALLGDRDIPPIRHGEGIPPMKVTVVDSLAEPPSEPGVFIAPEAAAIAWRTSKTKRRFPELLVWRTESEPFLTAMHLILEVDPDREYIVEGVDSEVREPVDKLYTNFTPYLGRDIVLSSLRNLFASQDRPPSQRERDARFMAHGLAIHEMSYDQGARAAQRAEAARRSSAARDALKDADEVLARIRISRKDRATIERALAYVRS